MSDIPNLLPEDLRLIESMTESVLVASAPLDAPGPVIVYVNPAFERMTGWLKAEIIGQTPRILQGPKTDRSVFADLREALDRQGVWEGQTVNYRKDGTEFVMEWSIVPIHGSDGSVTHYLAVQRNVTARVQMERQLAEARETERAYSERLEAASRRLQMVNEEQQRTLELFTKYVPEAVVRKALDERQLDDLQNGQVLEVALLFCDLRGFTTHSESLPPAKVVHLLNTYYRLMAQVVRNHEGVIHQFVGDEILVTFGAPVPIRDREEKAVRCAVGMVEQLPRINAILHHDLGSTLRVKIGVNSGKVVAGNLGSEERLTYSITGDVVNTAKRIESLSPEDASPILISEAVYREVRDLVRCVPWPPLRMKGKQAEVRVHHVLGLADPASPDSA